MKRIVIAGGGLAAARVGEQLRAQGFDGEVTMLCAEPRAPYDRPPLTKAALVEEQDTALATDYGELGVDVRLNTPAVSLDPAEDLVHTAQGPIAYDALVVATGARPLRLPGEGPQITVRRADDAARLRAELKPGRHILLVGAGWLNAEVATAAARQGCTVTCVEAAPNPLHSALGQVGDLTRPWWAGTDLRTTTAVEEVTGDGVRLGDGTHLRADAVVTGTGARPDTGWLEGSGVAVDRGVLTDEHLRSSRPGVYALGDVAARWSPRWHTRLRIEHWDEARSAAATAAASALAGTRPERTHDPVPYFWSDQFGRKLQYVGHHTGEDTAVVRGEGSERWGVAWLAPDGRLTAHLSTSTPRQMVDARNAIEAGARPDPELAADPTARLAPPR